MATRSRRLPPLVADADRIEAARIAADRLKAELCEAELVRAAWTETPSSWSHYIDSMGGIHSERQP